jgi:YgiT-type zinc finger domain-containing protein
MICVAQKCSGKMYERKLTHVFTHTGEPLVVEDIPALVCSVCGYAVLDLRVLDALLRIDPEADKPAGQAPVFRLIQRSG